MTWNELHASFSWLIASRASMLFPATPLERLIHPHVPPLEIVRTVPSYTAGLADSFSWLIASQARPLFPAAPPEWLIRFHGLSLLKHRRRF